MYTLSTIYIYIYTHETLEYHIPPHTGAQTGIVILLWGRRSALLPIPPLLPPFYLNPSLHICKYMNRLMYFSTVHSRVPIHMLTCTQP